MDDALQKDYDVKGSDIYVAGYFSKTGILFFKKVFTCPVCILYMEKYGISNIWVPMPDGWIKRTLEEAKEDSIIFKQDPNRLNARLNVLVGNYNISLL